MAENLKQKATASMVWTAAQKYSMMIIGFISGIVLARLLTPHDYGCIGMLSIFMVLANTFIDGGFGSALIQKKNPTQVDYSTIFFWNMGMSVFVYAILFVCAPAISRFYSMPILCNVLRVQALVLFIYAFNMVQVNQLKKKLNFKFISIVTVSTAAISLAVTIVLAYKGFGVWALVVQNLISAAIPAVANCVYVKWRPIWTFSWKSFKELFSFGVYMFLSSIVNNISAKINGLLIGKMYDPNTMGYYSKAVSTEDLASSSISSVLTPVTYPLYSQVQDDKAKIVNIIKRLTSTVAYISFPLMFVLILVAEPLFTLLYSEKWLPCVPYFRILCLAGLVVCLQGVNTQPLAAIGKSRLMFQWSLIKKTYGLALMFAGIFLFGVMGLMWSLVIKQWIGYAINIGLVSKHIGYNWRSQVKDLLPMLLVSTFAAGVAYGVASLCHLGLYMDGVLKAVICLGIYMGWSLIFKPESYTYTLTIIPEKFRFWERKSK